MESLQDILGRGRHSGGMKKFKKFFHSKENVSKTGRLEEVETVTRLLNVHPILLCTMPEMKLKRMFSRQLTQGLLKYTV